MRKILFSVALVISMMLTTPALARHVKVRHSHRPHHAHLIKHPRTVDVTVTIPPSALRHRPARAKKHRRRS